MTEYAFCAGLLAVTALYTFGDLLASRAEKHDSILMHRVGCMMIAAAVAGLVCLALALRGMR